MNKSSQIRWEILNYMKMAGSNAVAVNAHVTAKWCQSKGRIYGGRWRRGFETVTSNCESIRAPPAFITSVMKLFVAGLPAWLFLKRGLAAFICIPRSASVLRRAVSLWIFLLLILRDVQNFMAQAGVGKKTSSNHCLSRRGKNKYSIKPHLMKRGNDSRATVCITAW